MKKEISNEYYCFRYCNSRAHENNFINQLMVILHQQGFIISPWLAGESERFFHQKHNINPSDIRSIDLVVKKDDKFYIIEVKKPLSPKQGKEDLEN